MYDSGYTHIMNIDISRTVIAAMAERTAGRDGLTWEVMSCTALTLGDSSVDAIIDKGTIDALLSGENSAYNASIVNFEPFAEGHLFNLFASCCSFSAGSENTGRACTEAARVLRPGGCFIVVSLGAPDKRLRFLESDSYKWKVREPLFSRTLSSGSYH
jgi:EEF1A lysine methyltransferase 4